MNQVEFMVESKKNYERAKRLIDIVISGIVMILLTPLLIVASIVVWQSMGHPILYMCQRAGRNGRPFVLFKFRSMTNERDVNGNLLPEKHRITVVGKLIRRTSVDELPQLYNILIGDMSIVGPRPLPVSYNKLYSDRHALRLSVKPGLTGWCQINFHGDDRTWQEKLDQDVYYVMHRGIMIDLQIMFLTVAVLVRRFLKNKSGLTTSPSALDGIDQARHKFNSVSKNNCPRNNSNTEGRTEY
jgi:lipopolysaccharide/colanic/teichoic acid biosynthesis glycosyltransferase